MFQFSATSTATVSLFNRAYAKGKIDVKNLTFTLSLVSDELDLRDLQKDLDKALVWVYNRIVIQNDDPYLIHLLEPKSGATVHNLLNEIRNMETGYTTLGDTIPPDTIDAYKLTVFNSSIYTATMEGIVKFVFDRLDGSSDHSLSVNDGTYYVQV